GFARPPFDPAPGDHAIAKGGDAHRAQAEFFRQRRLRGRLAPRAYGNSAQQTALCAGQADSGACGSVELLAIQLRHVVDEEAETGAEIAFHKPVYDMPAYQPTQITPERHKGGGRRPRAALPRGAKSPGLVPEWSWPDHPAS